MIDRVREREKRSDSQEQKLIRQPGCRGLTGGQRRGDGHDRGTG